MENQIKALLEGVIHPETGESIVKSGIVEKISIEGTKGGETQEKEKKITLTLRFLKNRDPFAVKIKREVEQLLREHYANYALVVILREGEAQKPQAEKPRTTTSGIAHVVAIASGKGGVGKSTVTANLALTLRDMGYRVGVLDADIYGPSQPKMFGVEGYMPEAEHDPVTQIDQILPAEVMDLKLISIGFFVQPTDALMWRGTMASNALKQLIHQTKWGPLDFLLIDMPPGTGDIHIQLINELKLSGAVIISTPQQVAVADVVRGVEMFRHPQVNVPVTGIVENMAWFSPEELPQNRYYLFGRGGAREYAEQNGIPFLGEIPIIQSVMEGAEKGSPAILNDERVKDYYLTICEKIVQNVVKGC